MPKTSSAKKALRQNKTRNARNVSRKNTLKIAVKNFSRSLSTSKEEAKTKLAETYKTIDKMAKVKLIKKGKANRMKSRLAKKLK
ncbi:MAG: small subunit ribosomal protein S20 [Parcubacteria group bacterium LiPW_41]|nr:MAG: small subunit ribosomal protein S20 [Parcubacteria group bacterium LiPW_41]